MATPLNDGKPKKIVMVLYSAGQDLAKSQPKLLGCVENALGLREWLESQGHTLVVTADKEGPDCELEKHIPDADVIITTPFHPGYLTKERLEKAKNLKLALTAGVGSDHVDLLTARDNGITVAEVTGCNVVSVAEHVVMQMLILIRNFVPAYTQVCEGGWDVAQCVQQSYDLENKVVGTIGAGRIGQRVLKRLAGFDCKELLYYDYARLDPTIEKDLNCTYAELDDLISRCDIVTINCPLHESTRGMVNKEFISKMKDGAYIVNTARGAICNKDDVAEACNSGKLAGYAGDVWYPQPAPPDHPWRSMKKHAMTPHMSGSSLDAQARYAAGVKEILKRSFAGEALNPADVIVQGGKLAPQYDKAAAAEERNLKHAPGWEK